MSECHVCGCPPVFSGSCRCELVCELVCDRCRRSLTHYTGDIHLVPSGETVCSGCVTELDGRLDPFDLGADR